jgi:hypothetical protein
MDQWVSQKDNTKATAWKIVDDYYMEVVPDAGGNSN